MKTLRSHLRVNSEAYPEQGPGVYMAGSVVWSPLNLGSSLVTLFFKQLTKTEIGQSECCSFMTLDIARI